jgi:hypothetical protein
LWPDLLPLHLSWRLLLLLLLGLLLIMLLLLLLRAGAPSTHPCRILFSCAPAAA